MIEQAAAWAEANQALLWWLGAGSFVMFIGSLLALPWVIGRLPADYFAHERRPPSLWADRPAASRLALRLGKNVLGVMLLLAGAAMLVAPGQGLLTILVGFVLIDFPGKYRLERRVASVRRVRRGLDWMRRRRGKAPLEVWGTGPD